jgi:Rrf2 family transcriptional regulator, iron-sulfur cluster assembly transcription factor
MFNYSKLAQAGISAVSYLAGIADEARLAGSAEIAEARELSHQLIAKVLTLLSRFGIVEGTRGPSGGYRLARPAAEITLFDVVRVFEDPDERVMCPFGPNWCGHGSPCPLHDKFIEMHQSAIDRLTAETFAQFEKSDGLLQKIIEPQMDADGRR